MSTFPNVTYKNFPESHAQQTFLLNDKIQIPRCHMPAQRIPRFRPGREHITVVVPPALPG